jgi:tetratricopeptide (TPR) repeat protein
MRSAWASVQQNANLALSEPTADRWNNIGGAYFRLNNRDAAMASFQTALQLDPCNFASRRNVMMLYSQRNDLHGVWQTGELPRACQMIPDQAGELQRLRKMAGKP